MSLKGPTPDMLAKSGTEHSQQVALFAWAALNQQQYPMLRWMHAIPNGGMRGDGSRQGAAIAGGMLKAEGVKSGVFDVFLPYPTRTSLGGVNKCGLYIEMKKVKGVVSEEQRQFGYDMTIAGYQVAICYSWQEAVAVIQSYLI